jgi:hypothetical protein
MIISLLELIFKKQKQLLPGFLVWQEYAALLTETILAVGTLTDIFFIR